MKPNIKPKYGTETLSSKLIRETPGHDTIYYCLVQKESESGLMYNERLLVLQESDQSIFYTNSIPTKPFSKSSTLPSGKMKLRLGEIKYEKDEGSNSLKIKLEK